MKVQEIMTTDPAFCTRTTGLQAAAKMMCESDCGEIPVVDDQKRRKPVGVITDRDIACRAVAQGKNPLSLTVGDCMTSPPVTIAQDADVETCFKTLATHRIRRILVVDREGRCRGIVSLADVARKCGPEKAGEVVREVSTAAA